MCRSAMRLLTSQRDALLTTFCLLAMLAFLPFHGKNHKNSRSFGKEHKNSRFFQQKLFNVSKILCSGFKSACAKGFHRKAEPCLRLFVCSQCSHFCRFAAKNTKIRGSFDAFLGKVRTHFARLAYFWGKCERILLLWRVFGESASAFCFHGVFSGKVRLRTARLARFWGKCVCARGGNGAFWGKVRVHYGDWSKNYKKIRRGLKTASKIPPLFLTREFLFRKNSRLFTAIFHFVAKSLF